MSASTTAEPSTKDKVFNLIPPAMVVTVLLFWSYGPKALLDNPWMLTVTSPLIVLTVLGLEFVNERHESWRINWREFFTDMFYVVLSATVIAWFTRTLVDDPLLSLKASLGISTTWAMTLPWLAQVGIVVVVWEFGQYWMHRLMHNVHPFWLTHAPHHHLIQLNAAKGAVGNPIELFLITLSVVALFDLEATALFAAFNVLGVVSTFAHANVKADPPIWYSYVFTTIRHHSLHHSHDYENTRSNYGNSLILLDRIFGTYREGEGVILGQDERRRLSIWEQTVFPFKGLIDRFKARRSGSADGTSGGTQAA